MFTQFGETGKYPGVSITGSACSLNCDHCGAKILHTMPNCNTPEKLVNYAIDAEKKGAVGILVSGGSLKNGKLPWEKFAPALKIIRQETNLFLSVHCGFPDDAQMKLLKSTGINQALIDVIGDDEVAQRVYHLPPNIAKNAAISAFESDVEIVPHVLVGLDYGKPSGEEKALELISRYNPKKVVIIALRPTAGTPMKKSEPPTPERIIEIIKLAKNLMPTAKINLGCARPGGLHKRKLDKLALLAGVDGISVPANGTYEMAIEMGFEVFKHPTCCSMNISE
jgi:lipoyl synthase